MVVAWILHSVEKELVETLLYFRTAKEIWDELRMRFGSPNSTRLYQVQKEMFNISLSGSSITSYFLKFKKLWDEYMDLVESLVCNACGAENPVSRSFANQQVI